MENGPGLKMYFHVFPIENGDIPASYVSLPEGIADLFCRGYIHRHP